MSSWLPGQPAPGQTAAQPGNCPYGGQTPTDEPDKETVSMERPTKLVLIPTATRKIMMDVCDGDDDDNDDDDDDEDSNGDSDNDDVENYEGGDCCSCGGDYYEGGSCGDAGEGDADDDGNADVCVFLFGPRSLIIVLF